MIETSFAGRGPVALLGSDDETPFIALPIRRKSGLRTLRRLDAMTEILDRVLAEALEARHDLTPLSTDLDWRPVPTYSVGQPTDVSGLREQALAAVADIRSTLAVSDAATAKLVGVARNTLASWRRGERDPYPATVRTLFEIHSAVSAASTLLGSATASWFNAYSGDQTRLAILGSPGGVARITSELRADLFPGVGTLTLPGPDELNEQQPPLDAEYVPEAFVQPIRRRRREW